MPGIALPAASALGHLFAVTPDTPASAPETLSNLCPHHIIPEIPGLGRLLGAFEALEAEHDGHLLLSLVEIPRHSYVITVLAFVLHPGQEQMVVIVVAMEQEAVVHGFIGGRREQHEIRWAYGKVLPLILERPDMGINRPELRPFVFHGLYLFFC